MFEITPINVAIIIGFALIFLFIFRASTSENRAEYSEDMTNEQLKNLVYSLAKTLKENGEEDARLHKRVQDLQYSDGLMREQTKFLTANVNRTTSVL
tara:strand:- start:877 stop:1167 length:291 start_codon:yes stop_codon:yes gene_type:complete